MKGTEVHSHAVCTSVMVHPVIWSHCDVCLSVCRAQYRSSDRAQDLHISAQFVVSGECNGVRSPCNVCRTLCTNKFTRLKYALVSCISVLVSVYLQYLSLLSWNIPICTFKHFLQMIYFVQYLPADCVRIWFRQLKNWCRFQEPSGLRRGSAADRLLGLRVRIPPGHEYLFLVGVFR
jgi:hypothetical protein